MNTSPVIASSSYGSQTSSVDITQRRRRAAAASGARAGRGWCSRCPEPVPSLRLVQAVGSAWSRNLWITHSTGPVAIATIATTTRSPLPQSPTTSRATTTAITTGTITRPDGEVRNARQMSRLVASWFDRVIGTAGLPGVSGDVGVACAVMTGRRAGP